MAQILQLISPSTTSTGGINYEMRPDLTQAESIRFETNIVVCVISLLGTMFMMSVPSVLWVKIWRFLVVT